MDVHLRLFSCVLVLRKGSVGCDAFVGVPFTESDSDIGIALQDLWRELDARLHKATFNGWKLDHISITVLAGEAAQERAKDLGGDLKGPNWSKVLKGPLYTSTLIWSRRAR